MGFFSKVKQRLLGPAKTAQYSHFPDQAYTHVRDLPLFTFHTIRYMLIDPTLRLGLAIRRAPLQQAEFSYQVTGPEGTLKWVPGVKASRPDVAQWVQKQLNRIWQFDLHKILSNQIWGWSAGEVTWRLGPDQKLHVDRILIRSARDVYALRHKRSGTIQGVRFHRIGGGKEQVDLTFPQCFWVPFFPESESPYGVSILKGSHSAWADKWLNGGGLDVRRTFMHKDAYGGMDMGYPAGTTNIDGKGEVPNRDIAREIVEQAKAGQVITRPSNHYPDGQEMWPINYAHVPANPVHILQYPKDLDIEMLHGLEIPDDLILHQGSGAWQGKQVPMQAFFTSEDIWLAQVVEAIVTQILEPGVLINWGQQVPFDVRTKPLADQAMEQIRSQRNLPSKPFAKSGAGQSKNGRSGRRLFRRLATEDRTAAEYYVGRGVIDAAELIEAGRRYLDNGLPTSKHEDTKS